MTEWIDQFAEAIGTGPLTAAESNRLLTASREVAHRLERKMTPLSTFLAGMGVAARISQGMERDLAFDQVMQELVRLLPAASPDEDRTE